MERVLFEAPIERLVILAGLLCLLVAAMGGISGLVICGITIAKISPGRLGRFGAFAVGVILLLVWWVVVVVPPASLAIEDTPSSAGIRAPSSSSRTSDQRL